jgi:peroxiredoxin
LVQLQQDLQAIEATGTQVVAVSFDPVEVLRTFAERANISFLLLSDQSSKAIQAYGVHHRDGYPHPGTYLIDQQGTIRAELFLEGYRQRHDNDELIDAARQIGAQSKSP